MAQEGPEVVSTSHKHCTTLSKKPITLHPPLLTEPSKQIQHGFSRQGLRLSRIPNKNSWITALTVFPQFKNAYRRAQSVTTSVASSNWKFLQNAELLTLHNITGDFVPLNSCLFGVKTKAAKNNFHQCFSSSVNQQQFLQLLQRLLFICPAHSSCSLPWQLKATVVIYFSPNNPHSEIKKNKGKIC